MAKETQNNGFIKIHRNILDWQHWGEPNVVSVFLTLLLLANHKKGWWQGLKCGRGETFVTIDTLSNITKLSKPTIIRILRLLEDSGEITRKKVDQKHTKTIVKKYNDYQDNSEFCSKTTLQQTLPQTLPQTLLKQERKERKEYIVVDNNNAHTHTHEGIVDDLMSNQILIEGFCKNEGITVNQCRMLAEAVVTEWELTEEPQAGRTRKHLISQIRTKAQAMKMQGMLTNGTLDERKAQFIAECKTLIAKGCSKSEVAEFASYYTQPTTDGRMLFETYKGWNTETRFLLNQKRKPS